jgi:hypothetical protein
MHYIVRVTVRDTRQQLSDDLCCVKLSESTSLHNLIKQSAALYIFHHDVEILLIFKVLVDLYDARVIECLQNIDLTNDGFLGLIVEVLLLDPFDGTLIFALIVLTQKNFAECTSTQRLAHLIVII